MKNLSRLGANHFLSFFPKNLPFFHEIDIFLDLNGGKGLVPFFFFFWMQRTTLSGRFALDHTLRP